MLGAHCENELHHTSSGCDRTNKRQAYEVRLAKQPGGKKADAFPVTTIDFSSW